MTEKAKKEKEAEARERKRAIALRNLGEKTLQNLSLAYLVHKNKQFGEADNSVVEEFKYMPAIRGDAKHYNLETGKEGSLLIDSLLGSRNDGERYSGNVSESKIISDASKIIQESLEYVKIGDVLQLMGSDSKTAGRYENMYLYDLVHSNDKEAKEFATTVMNSYLTYNISNGVSDAHSQRAGSVKKSLESMLTELNSVKEK